MKIEILNSPDGTPNAWMFYCVACKDHHSYTMNRGWSFNGDFEKPTFTPSLLVRWEFNGEQPEKRCHLFVQDGKIKYCGDCTHSMAGQTIDMVDI